MTSERTSFLMADNENAPTVGTTVEGTPGTGETATNPAPADNSGLEDKLAMWQAMSRENEKKMHANMKRATEAEGKLAEVQHQYEDAQVTIAKLKAQAAYPQLTDDVFDKLAPKDADAAAIEEWAKNAASFIQPAAKQEPSATESSESAKPFVTSTGPDFVGEAARTATALHSIGSNHDAEKAGYEYGSKFAAVSKDTK